MRSTIVLIHARDVMLFSYRKFLTLPSGIEFLVMHTGRNDFLCIQGTMKLKDRIKRAYVCAGRLKQSDPENALIPLSFGEKRGQINAVFEGDCGGLLQQFLKMVPASVQYAQGKKVGRILKAFHTQPLNAQQLKRADMRQEHFLERLATYISSMPRFVHEQIAIDAISRRFGSYGCFRPAMRYGQLRADRICVRDDFSTVLLPSCVFGPGDVCEDFALLETMSAGSFPCYCAGVLDGYFVGEIPTTFWVSFALQSALYSLWRCGKTAMISKKAFELMQAESQRIADDFNGFKDPVPKWYLSKALNRVKAEALKAGL